MKKTSETGSLHLPVFKQGDDLLQCIRANDTLADAFIDLSKTYIAASELCRRIASVAAEHKLAVYSSGHVIDITGPIKVITSLIDDGILAEFDSDSSEDEEDEYEEDLGARETD